MLDLSTKTALLSSRLDLSREASHRGILSRVGGLISHNPAVPRWSDRGPGAPVRIVARPRFRLGVRGAWEPIIGPSQVPRHEHPTGVVRSLTSPPETTKMSDARSSNRRFIRIERRVVIANIGQDT